MAAMVALVVAAVLGGVVGAGERWQPRMAGGGKTRLRSRRLVQGEGITRAIQEVKLGLDEDTEDLIVPEWFEGFGDKEVVEKNPTEKPAKYLLLGTKGQTRKQPTGSKGRKDPKKSQGSARLNLLTRNNDVNKGGGDETRGQVMSIVKRRRRPEKKEQTLRGAEKVAHDDPWSPQANSQTTMAPSTYQDYKTSLYQQTNKNSLTFGTNPSKTQSVPARDHSTTGFQDFFPPHSPQEFFGLEARGGHHAKRYLKRSSNFSIEPKSTK